MASRVTCTTKSSGQVTHLGGINDNGTNFYVSEENAIVGIKTKSWSFYVQDGQKKVAVVIATRNEVEYLKTENDGVDENNLLSLQDCR